MADLPIGEPVPFCLGSLGEGLDLHAALIPNPVCTFYMRASGNGIRHRARFLPHRLRRAHQRARGLLRQAGKRTSGQSQPHPGPFHLQPCRQPAQLYPSETLTNCQSRAAFLLNVVWLLLGGLLMGLRWRTELQVSVACFGTFINERPRALSFSTSTPSATEAPYCEQPLSRCSFSQCISR